MSFGSWWVLWTVMVLLVAAVAYVLIGGFVGAVVVLGSAGVSVGMLTWLNG